MHFHLFFFFFNINIRDVSSLKNIYPSFVDTVLVRIFEIISCTVLVHCWTNRMETHNRCKHRIYKINDQLIS